MANELSKGTAGRYVGPAWRAVLSDDGVYRYVLRRDIGMLHGSRGSVTFIMLNPSTADARDDDPTIRRCISFAQRQEAAYLEVVNLFAFRATDPRDLPEYHVAVGPLNDQYIRGSVRSADTVICAWGVAQDVSRRARADVVLEIIRECGKDPMCLGVAKHGDPLHPLYLSRTRTLVSLSEARSL